MAESTEDPTPPTPAPAEPPEWAVQLKTTIEELPGKLRASVTDDDKRGIAETVHGLFEKSGAFEHEVPTPTVTETETEVETPTTVETPPKKVRKVSRFASWFAGDGE